MITTEKYIKDEPNLCSAIRQRASLIIRASDRSFPSIILALFANGKENSHFGIFGGGADSSVNVSRPNTANRPVVEYCSLFANAIFQYCLPIKWRLPNHHSRRELL